MKDVPDNSPISPLRALEALAHARAILLAAGEYGDNDVTLPLWHFAEKHGLVEELGAHAIRTIIETALQRVQSDG